MDIHSQVLSYDIPVKTLLTTATFRQFFQNREISLKTQKKPCSFEYFTGRPLFWV